MSSPLIFESSDEETSRPLSINSNSKNDIPKSSCVLEKSSPVKEVSEEQKRRDRVRTLLMGVPPPPAVTVSQYNYCEMLQLYKKNSPTFEWSDNKVNMVQLKELTEMYVTGDWSVVRDGHWFNVSYNRSFISEELALLTVKYQERYISNETSSSVNSFFSRSPIRTASAKKRARRHAWGHSPGRRLSHLARRRNTFSSASLQQNASKTQPDKKKMILVERKKAQALKRGRNSATKASGSARPAKPVSTVNTKRALFQSPENDKKNSSLRLSNNCESSLKMESAIRSKRALWPDKPNIDKENGSVVEFNATGKRVAESLNSSSTIKKKCFRSLSFGEDKQSCTNNTTTNDSMPSLPPEELSQLHKKTEDGTVTCRNRSRIKMSVETTRITSVSFIFLEDEHLP